MNRPPLMMHLRIQRGRRRFGLWLPLFLIAPLVLAVAIILSPAVLVYDVVQRCRGRGKPLLLAVPAIFGVFCALRGLEMDFKKSTKQTSISFK